MASGLGGEMRSISAPGSATAMLESAVGSSASGVGVSGTTKTALIMIVKWSVALRVTWRFASSARRGSATHFLAAVSKK